MIVALLSTQPGCARSVPRLPPPPSEQLRAHFGTIGVVSVQFVPKVKMLTPAKGRASAAAREAAKSHRKMVQSIPYLQPPLDFICCLVLTPFTTCIGVLKGAGKAPPASEVEEKIEELNKEVPAGIEIQEKMRAQFLKVAREKTHYAFVVLEDQGPATPDEKLSYDSLAVHGIDTVLEIGVLNLGLEGDWEEIDPPLTFFMTSRTRLIRVADEEVIYAATFSCGSGTVQTFEAWAADEAQSFKKALSNCDSTLAAKIVEQIFLLTVSL
jgi:hypothetical protein